MRVLLPLLGGKAYFRIHSIFFHVLWQCVFGVKDYVMLWLNIVDVLGLGSMSGTATSLTLSQGGS